MWLKDTFTDGQAWVDLIGLANHTNGYLHIRGIRFPILRGEVGWSQVRLAERWHWSRGKVIRYLNHLELEHFIVQQKNNVSLVVTIVNYDKYQTDSTASDTADGQQTEQQTDTNKKGKEGERTITGDLSTTTTTKPTPDQYASSYQKPSRKQAVKNMSKVKQAFSKIKS